jgi:hypothetical protein
MVDARSRRKVLPRAADRIKLNRMLEVSPLCLGAVDDPRTVSHAFDIGINFFFLSADLHWPVYEATRRGLVDLLSRTPSVRDRIVVAVATYVTQPVFFHAPFREALEAVPGLGHIDVTVAGGSYRADFSARAALFAQHGELGARACGASFHDRGMASKAFRERLVDIGFVRYNSVHRGAEKDLFPHIRRTRGRRRALVYNFKSTQGCLSPERYAELGLSAEYWQPSPTDHYRFVLARPEIDGLLCAPGTPAQVAAIDDALAHGPLTDEENDYIRDLSDLALGKASLA